MSSRTPRDSGESRFRAAVRRWLLRDGFGCCSGLAEATWAKRKGEAPVGHMNNYVKLPTSDEHGILRIVVETPRGSRVKTRFDENLFVSAVLFEEKRIRIEGWDGPKTAEKLIRRAQKAFAGDESAEEEA